MFNRLAASIVCVALAAGLCLAGAASQPAMSKEVADANALLDAMKIKYQGAIGSSAIAPFERDDGFIAKNGATPTRPDCANILKAFYIIRVANDPGFTAIEYTATVDHVLPPNASKAMGQSSCDATLTKRAGTMKPTITFH